MKCRTPRVEIVYCTQCRWLLRAAWMAQELLTTFADELGEVAPGAGDGRRVSDSRGRRADLGPRGARGVSRYQGAEATGPRPGCAAEGAGPQREEVISFPRSRGTRSDARVASRLPRAVSWTAAERRSRSHGAWERGLTRPACAACAAGPCGANICCTAARLRAADRLPRACCRDRSSPACWR